ncbi:hypothetical protein, partial [Microcoleus sp. K5-D4]|uniref:hypothetical protein n=1 Tax=Microcoleus sp. K5-D4 TaxID=2818801 RepID=UPI002FD5F3C2
QLLSTRYAGRNPYTVYLVDLFVTPPAADDKGLTLIHAEVEKRDRNNSDANKFEITIFASFLTSPKTDTCERLLLWREQNFRLLFKLPDSSVE